ncbi:IS3 family transposase [Pseudocolwellia sp. AS88]|uniref:IS3 family transposase n=1 Tax=Pseudocolwellia sp. AS88 TaxID=3063958 RepID=UPI00316E4CFC
MKSTTKRTQKDYSIAFKLGVVEQVERGELTYKQAQDKYGIQGCSTVLIWLRKHGRLDWSNGTPIFLTRGFIMAKSQSPQTPEQRIKELEQKLAESQLKSQFFEAVVNVLETDYGVRINKKAESAVIQQKRVNALSVVLACRFLGITRQAYYKRCVVKKKRDKHEQLTLNIVMAERMLQPRIGTRKLQNIMALQQHFIGRDHLFSLLKSRRLLVAPKRAYHKTTDSHHRFTCHPNLIKGGFTPQKPEELWVADITYLPTVVGNTYLSLVTDAYSRKIVGFHLDDNMKTQSVKQAFSKALSQRYTTNKLIHHSDRGVQYCSNQYQALHKRYAVTCSMTDGYDCYQNALAERINGILKNEYLLVKPNDLDEARKMVEESVMIYNERRPHTALKYKTPNEVHQAF